MLTKKIKIRKNMLEENTRERLNCLFHVAELSSQFDCLPNGEPILCHPRSKTSYSPEKHHSLER